jgi:hypothetical protein
LKGDAAIYDLQQRIALHEDMKADKKLYDLLFHGLDLYSITKNFPLNYISKSYKNVVVNLDTIDTEPAVTILKTKNTFYEAAS